MDQTHVSQDCSSHRNINHDPSLTNAVTGDAASAAPPALAPVTLRINGAVHQLTIDPRATLLDTLRERRALTGAKKGCDRGACGACTVHVNEPSHQCVHGAGDHARGSGGHHD